MHPGHPRASESGFTGAFPLDSATGAAARRQAGQGWGVSDKLGGRKGRRCMFQPVPACPVTNGLDFDVESHHFYMMEFFFFLIWVLVKAGGRVRPHPAAFS